MDGTSLRRGHIGASAKLLPAATRVTNPRQVANLHHGIS